MSVKVYKSTDASAPALSGTVGSMTAVLAACLVTGYGTQTGAGWSSAFTGTNQTVFRPGSGVRHFFHVDDNAPDATAAAKEAQIAGSETATAWRTGTNFFPTAAQETESGLVIRKSATADATARPWLVIADDRTAYVFAQTGDAAGVYMGAAFGEFYSLLTTADAFRSMVIARNLKNSAVTTTGAPEQMPALAPTPSSTLSGHYMARVYTGLGGSTPFRKWGDGTRAGVGSSSTYANGSQGLVLPEPVTGAIHVAPIHLNGTTNIVHGRMRGNFHLCHDGRSAMNDGDVITGAGAYAGRSFLVVRGTGLYAMLFDITGPWETN